MFTTIEDKANQQIFKQQIYGVFDLKNYFNE